jgi:uncharacterized protein (TIGR01777 family)
MAGSSLPRALVSGASGLIGAALLPALRASGFEVVRLVRRPSSSSDEIEWDPTRPLTPDKLSGFEAVIHLAGENVAGRWTEAKKAAIRDSRVQGTRNLAQALARVSSRRRVLITASAVGYYGDRGNEVLSEDSPSGSGFLAEVCREWEAATLPAKETGIRTAHMRTGVVLSSKGGALQKMLPPFRLGVGGRLGSGREWMSWIHVQDLVAAVLQILQNESLQGPVNMVAPQPVTNAEFTGVLGSVLSRPTVFPVPAFVVQGLFGQMGREVLLASQRVEPKRLIASGFTFQYSTLAPALESLLKA